MTSDVGKQCDYCGDKAGARRPTWVNVPRGRRVYYYCDKCAILVDAGLKSKAAEVRRGKEKP